jgi:hypothetical protein
MTVINLAAEAERRERFTIALADAIGEMFGLSCPEDPEPFQPTMIEIVAEMKAMTADDLDFDYRCAVAHFVTLPGGIVHHEADPAPHHQACLVWSREFLARIERDFGVRLLDLRGVPA